MAETNLPVPQADPGENIRRKTVRHLCSLARPWYYTKVDGEVRRYGPEFLPAMMSHARRRTHLFLEALCSEITGVMVPLVTASVENRTTKMLTRVTCEGCRVALDVALKQGRVRTDDFDERKLQIRRAA